RRHFREGCICPAMVVSTSPYLVAGYDNLGVSWSNPWPAITIVQVPLHRMPGGPPDLDARLAALCMISGTPTEREVWEYVVAKIVDLVSRDGDEVERDRSSIPKEEWMALEEGICQIPEPYTPGLFPIKLSKERTVDVEDSVVMVDDDEDSIAEI